MTWLDSAIGWLSPQAGLRRVRARATMQALSGFAVRSYEGAKAGRRTDGWITSDSDANTEIGPAMARLRARARDLVRNNPYAARGVKAHAANTIGCGILPRATPQVDEVWARWAEQADADGRTDFYGLQTIVLRALVESGEVLVRRRAPWGDFAPLPLQLQIMESDFLDGSRDNSRAGDGGWIRHGIEYDARGKRVAYWLFRAHPGSQDLAFRGGLESSRVPADEILHIFDPLRAGQGRGVTWFAPAVTKLRDLDDYDEAELVRKKIEACLAAFVTTDDDSKTLGAGAIEETTGRRLEDFSPGMIEYLRPSESVTISQPGFAAGGAYSEYMRGQLHAIAAALDLTYELLTGDLSQVNFSSARVGLLEFRRRVRQVQTQILVPQLLLPAWRWFSDLGVVSGVLTAGAGGRIPVSWTFPRFESVQPLQDAMEELTRLRSGTLSLPEAIAARGYDANDMIAEIAEWNKKLDELGIVLDSDPRKVAKSGGAQPGADMGGDGAAGGGSAADGVPPGRGFDGEVAALQLSLAEARRLRARGMNGIGNGHA